MPKQKVKLLFTVNVKVVELNYTINSETHTQRILLNDEGGHLSISYIASEHSPDESEYALPILSENEHYLITIEKVL